MTIEHSSSARTGSLKWIAWAVAALALLGLAWWVWTLLKQPVTKAKPSKQQIQLVRPNQPPPPPPKPPEKPPEPPKIKEEVKVEQPRPVEQPKTAETPPPSERLGVDAAGSGSGDSFGLAANQGGRDLLNSAPTISGAGGGGAAIARAQYGFYRELVTRHVNEELNRVTDLKTSDGQLAILVWVDRNGRIERVDLRDATARQSELIRERLMSSKPLREPPPAPMPQPMWILLNLRDLG